MLFTEPAFLFLFLPVLLALVFAPALARRRAAHAGYANACLLAASIIFYAKGGGAFTWLMLASIAFNYAMAIAIDRARGTPRRAERLLAAAVGVDLLVLIVFKYTGFFGANINALFLVLHIRPVVVPRVLLPIGISFFTFHAISYVVDVYRRDALAQKSPVHAALYLLLFPQLIAGPIIRYRQIADQLAARRVTFDDFAYGVRRFIIGLGKKVLVANTVAGPADRIFALPIAQVSAAHAWLAVVCYTIQIYFDFSGYSDMAIGLGRMFGFRFPENFLWPYISESIQEFWRRWHISLSSWFRDYVYIPLGGSRVSPRRTYVNLVAIFFLCGLWHGASWNFVIWGLFHGVFLVLERLGLVDLMRHLRPTVRHVYVMLVVMIGWVFFRADTLAAAIGFLEAMAGLTRAEPTPLTLSWYLTPDVVLALAAGIAGSIPIVPVAEVWRRSMRPVIAARAVELLGAAALSAILALSIVQCAAGSYNPFIYFRF